MCISQRAVMQEDRLSNCQFQVSCSSRMASGNILSSKHLHAQKNVGSILNVYFLSRLGSVS